MSVRRSNFPLRSPHALRKMGMPSTNGGFGSASQTARCECEDNRKCGRRLRAPWYSLASPYHSVTLTLSAHAAALTLRSRVDATLIDTIVATAFGASASGGAPRGVAASGASSRRRYETDIEPKLARCRFEVSSFACVIWMTNYPDAVSLVHC